MMLTITSKLKPKNTSEAARTTLFQPDELQCAVVSYLIYFLVCCHLNRKIQMVLHLPSTNAFTLIKILHLCCHIWVKD